MSAVCLHAMVGEMGEEESPADDSEIAETPSQRIRRYQDSKLNEVSQTLRLFLHSKTKAVDPPPILLWQARG